jgi:hypothetical protein
MKPSSTSDKGIDSLVASETDASLINMGSAQDQTIRELAELISSVVGFDEVLSIRLDGLFLSFEV